MQGCQTPRLTMTRFFSIPKLSLKWRKPLEKTSSSSFLSEVAYFPRQENTRSPKPGARVRLNM
jgi:hypothetical protein